MQPKQVTIMSDQRDDEATSEALPEHLLLRVRDLQTYFFLHEGIVKAVDGVSFDVLRGKTLGIIGESGSGKSVAAQSIMRLTPPVGKIVEGEILLNQASGDGDQRQVIDLAALPLNSRELRAVRWSEIAMIFQEPMTSFSPVHTIGDQITEAMLLHDSDMTMAEARKRAIHLLSRVGISGAQDLIDSYSFQFSGGMRQRAMIAMALACNPQLLIADEPTTALDVTIEAQILALIKQLQAEYNMAVIFITHDLAVIGEMADHVVVMYLGQVMEQANVQTIFEEPLHPYTRALWRSIPTVDGDLVRLKPIDGALPNPYEIPPGCPFYSRCEEAIPGTCDLARPPLIEITPGHTVRCVLYADGYEHG